MCEFSPPCVIRPSGDWPEIEWDGPALGKRAAARPSERRIWVDRDAWNKLEGRPRVRLALISRMQAHLEGAECEECTISRLRELLADQLKPITFDEVEQLIRELEAGNWYKWVRR